MNDLLSAAIAEWFAAYVARRGEGPSLLFLRRQERQHVHGGESTIRRLLSDPARAAADTNGETANLGRTLTGSGDDRPTLLEPGARNGPRPR